MCGGDGRTDLGNTRGRRSHNERSSESLLATFARSTVYVQHFQVNVLRTRLLKVKMMSTGIVKWFSEREGFGSIQPDSGDQDVFVHISALKMSGMDTIIRGQKISYEIILEAERKLS